MQLRAKAAENLLPISFTVITLLIMVLEPTSSEWLRYQSNEVSSGQLWRLMTANLCHSNWNHWLLNITGLWLMDLFLQPVLSKTQRTSLLLFCCLVNVVLMHLTMNLAWYVGLSGALHGYLVGGALLSWSSSKRLNAAILVVIGGKLFVELFWQINQATEQLIGANVVEEAHSYGAVSALIYVLILYVVKKLKIITRKLQ